MKVFFPSAVLLTLPFASAEFKLFRTDVPADEQVPETLVDGQEVILASSRCPKAPYTIEFIPDDIETVSVRFMINGEMGKCERIAPFTIAGNDGAEYRRFKDWQFDATNTFTAYTYSSENCKGDDALTGIENLSVMVAPCVLPYFPGHLSVTAYDMDGRNITMSQGMSGVAVAKSGFPVNYTDGGASPIPFHERPDAAAIFPREGGGFYYVSNSETWDYLGGGVGVIEFNEDAEVIGYFRNLLNTSINCGGGKTPWGTWVSCEECSRCNRTGVIGGFVWQTDPSGEMEPRMTHLVDQGSNYESFSYDDRDPDAPVFFVTDDSRTGPLVRFTPDEAAIECYKMPDPADRWCTLESGTHTFLKIMPDATNVSGTFEWVDSRDNATSAGLYEGAEGIEVLEGMLFFVAKHEKWLFELDLDAGTYTRTSTVSGAFNLQPDQFKAINNDEAGNNMLYFCEDGGNECDLHGRNTLTGEYYTFMTGDGYETETTGLAFTADAKIMMLSFQSNPGIIWKFWRDDGLPFDGRTVDIKYHDVTSRRRLAENQQIRRALRNTGSPIITP